MRAFTYYGFLFVLLFFMSCNHEKPVNFIVGEPIVTNIITPQHSPPNPSLTFNFGSLELYQEINTINLQQFKSYGSFYTRDFTIYQINDLNLLEDNLYITEIYLYFIDNSLHKIQALTTKNMSDFFLSKYGGAKLVLRDRLNKEIVKQEGAVQHSSGNIILNKNLSNYKLKWKGPDRLISYQVDESDQKNFEALEELINLENQQKIKTQPKYVFTIQSDLYAKLLERVKLDEQSSL